MLKLFQQEKAALGSKITLTIVAKNEPKALFTELWTYILLFEKRFSRFLPNSELTAFNRNAGAKTHVSDEFHDVLQAAKRMSEFSGTLFNPFILPALQRAGYLQSLASGHQNDPQENFAHRSVVSPDKLKIGSDWAEIPHGTAIDLGGCGKGYIGDKLAEMTRITQVEGYWFSVGGDIVCGGTNEQNDPWVVHIQDVSTEDIACMRHITAPSEEQFAVATSATTARQGPGWHHIVDPATGKPVHTDITSSSVCASSLLEADVLASCAIICGSKKATAYLQERNTAAYLLQTDSTQKHHVIASSQFVPHQGDW